MNLNVFLNYIESITDLESLTQLSIAVRNRYRELLAEKARRNAHFRTGDRVSFYLKNGQKMIGVVERRGRVNYRIAVEDGRVYRVPMALVAPEKSNTTQKIPRQTCNIETIVPAILDETKRILLQSGIQLHVRYKRGVWATHFRHEQHIQYGEKCLRYQIVASKTSDNVAANLRRFRLKSNPPNRLAMLICHEVAHAVAHQRYGLGITPHGRQYYTVLTEIVESEFAELRNRLAVKWRELSAERSFR